MAKTQAIRYHDISVGHRVYLHEGKCRYPHGHNYRFHFVIEGGVDDIGRVLDFSVIKDKLCVWLEENWDHRFLLFEEDPMRIVFQEAEEIGVIDVPFNPTAENMARYLVEEIGPKQLQGTGARLVKVIVEETRKCSASYCIEEKG